MFYVFSSGQKLALRAFLGPHDLSLQFLPRAARQSAVPRETRNQKRIPVGLNSKVALCTGCLVPFAMLLEELGPDLCADCVECGISLIVFEHI